MTLLNEKSKQGLDNNELSIELKHAGDRLGHIMAINENQFLSFDGNNHEPIGSDICVWAIVGEEIILMRRHPVYGRGFISANGLLFADSSKNMHYNIYKTLGQEGENLVSRSPDYKCKMRHPICTWDKNGNVAFQVNDMTVQVGEKTLATEMNKIGKHDAIMERLFVSDTHVMVVKRTTCSDTLSYELMPIDSGTRVSGLCRDAYMLDGRALVLMSGRQQLMVFDGMGNMKAFDFQDQIKSMMPDYRDNSLACVDENNRLYVINAKCEEVFTTQVLDRVHSIRRCGNVLVTLGCKKLVNPVYSIATGEIITSYTDNISGTSDHVFDADVTHDGRFLILGKGNCQIRMIELPKSNIRY